MRLGTFIGLHTSPLGDAVVQIITATAPILGAIDTSGAPDVLTVEPESDGQVYLYLGAAAVDADTIIAGGGLWSDDYATTIDVENILSIDWTGVVAGAHVLSAVLVDGSNQRSEVSTAIVTLENAQTWVEFDGDAWLERNSDLVGVPATTQQMMVAFTYSMQAASNGVLEEVISTNLGTDAVLNIAKITSNLFDIKIEDDTNTTVYRLVPTGALVEGEQYLVLISADAETDGARAVVIDLADGSIHGSATDATPVDVTLSPPDSGWTIGAASTSGTRAMASQLERMMVWFNAYEDVSLPAVQEHFYDEGLLSVSDVVTNIGATPIINVSGADLITGTNAGSGGDFVKDGTGTISEVV